jgi:hypothetical protein
MMTYEYDAENSIIHLKASGVLVVDDPINYFREIDNDPAFRPKAEERIYFTHLDDIKFSFNDIVLIRNAFEQYGHGDKISHGLFIADSDLSYGMARMVMSIFGEVFDRFTVEYSK